MAIPNHIKDHLSMPVIGSPLFLVSGPELVIAQCKAGIIGSFPALNARPQHVLGEWITRN
jgi:nitronate monooxygenase